jgi:hypothetical protein
VEEASLASDEVASEVASEDETVIYASELAAAPPGSTARALLTVYVDSE